MKFKVNDCVSVNTARLQNPAIGFVKLAAVGPYGPIYDIELQDYPDIGEIKGVTENVMTLIVRELDNPTQSKITLGLKEVLKETISYLEETDVVVMEQYTSHDYNPDRKMREIKITMVLKENK